MRYEVVRLAQFLFALLVIGGAFGAGVMFGWARWGMNSRPAQRRSDAQGGERADQRRGSDQRQSSGQQVADVGPGRVSPTNLFAPDSGPATAVVIDVESAIDLRGPGLPVRSGMGPLALGHAIEPGQNMSGTIDPT